MSARSRPVPKPLSRRRLFRFAGLTAVAVPLAAACDSGYQPGPDPLLPIQEAATADARAADALGADESAKLVAAARATHSEAIRSEVDRQNSPKPAQPTQPPAPTVPGIAELGQRLGTAQQQAAALVSGAPRYRAGLLGSVAAGCAALRQLSPALGRDSAPDVPVHPVQTGPLPSESVNAVQSALAAEHAAIWIYGLVSAFLPAEYSASATAGTREHTERRDACERLLAANGAQPKPPEPAYVPPKPVTDVTSAQSVVGLAESDSTTAWRAVLERTDDAALRTMALEALTGSATRGTRWRIAAGEQSAAPAMPGQPTTQ